jgi:hypothetical protein
MASRLSAAASGDEAAAPGTWWERRRFDCCGVVRNKLGNEALIWWTGVRPDGRLLALTPVDGVTATAVGAPGVAMTTNFTHPPHGSARVALACNKQEKENETSENEQWMEQLFIQSAAASAEVSWPAATHGASIWKAAKMVDQKENKQPAIFR